MVKDRLATTEQLAFLYQTLAGITDAEQIEALMTDLCTIRETNEMATRLDVAKMLARGESYLRIQEATGSSATTIARVSKCINHGAGGYREVFGLEQSPGRSRREINTVLESVQPGNQSTPAAGGR